MIRSGHFFSKLLHFVHIAQDAVIRTKTLLKGRGNQFNIVIVPSAKPLGWSSLRPSV